MKAWAVPRRAVRNPLGGDGVSGWFQRQLPPVQLLQRGERVNLCLQPWERHHYLQGWGSPLLSELGHGTINRGGILERVFSPSKDSESASGFLTVPSSRLIATR